MLTEALRLIDPQAARALAAIPAATAALRRHLTHDPAKSTSEESAPRSTRPRRRGLGRGWKGVHVPR